jgi:hypothetical protein
MKTRRNKGYWIRDSATAHVADDSLTALEGVFNDRWFKARTFA